MTKEYYDHKKSFEKIYNKNVNRYSEIWWLDSSIQKQLLFLSIRCSI